MILRRTLSRSIVLTLFFMLFFSAAFKATGEDRAIGYSIDIPVLMYHGFTEEAEGGSFTMPIALFERQMEYLAKAGFTSVTPDDLAAASKGERPLPEKAVMITFDDWDPSHYELAVPVLDRLGLIGVFFVITNLVDEAQTARLREIAARGHVIGSHTVNHFRLTNKVCLGSSSVCCHDYSPCSDEEIKRELAESRQTLEQTLGTPVTALAWPWNYYNKRSVEIAREAGYRTVFAATVGKTERLDYIYRIGCSSVGDEFEKDLRERRHCTDSGLRKGERALSNLRSDFEKALTKAREPR